MYSVQSKAQKIRAKKIKSKKAKANANNINNIPEKIIKAKQIVPFTVKKSSVPNIGMGLFSNIKIKKDDIICEFRGKLIEPGSEIKLKSNRSNIFFNDGYVLECFDNDAASYSNDAINFPQEYRLLHESFESAEPFYKKHPNAKVNAKISVDQNEHLAVLDAVCDIEPGEEIFCHYSFTYWFIQELKSQRFVINPDRLEEGFPACIYEYPAFKAYIKEFYPDCLSTDLIMRDDDYDIILYFDEEKTHHVTIRISDYSKTTKTEAVKIEDLIN